MKKNLKYLTLIFIYLFLIKIDKALAYDINTINYYNCQNLDSNLVQSYGYNEEKNTTKCNDKDFAGWEIMFYDNQKGEYGRFCINGVEYYGGASNSACKQGSQMFSNGFSTSELNKTIGYGKIYLYALTTSTVPSFTAHFSAGTDDATGTMNDMQIVIGSKTKLPKNQFQREGYTFKGWNAYMDNNKGKRVWMCHDGELAGDCKNHGGLKVYSDEATVSQTGNPGYKVTFVAIWKSGSHYEPSVSCDGLGRDACLDAKCTFNDTYNFCSTTGLAYLSCGDTEDIPELAPVLISIGVTGLKTVAPIVLIIMSIIQLVRSITSGKEDDIKKAQTGLIKRVIAAVLVFFVIAIVQFIMLKVADGSEKDGLSKCFSCFLNGPGDCGSLYYKDASGNHIGIK